MRKIAVVDFMPGKPFSQRLQTLFYVGIVLQRLLVVWSNLEFNLNRCFVRIHTQQQYLLRKGALIRLLV